MGDFEHSLMYYHRGLRLRPELAVFRLGVQKAQEAIENTIGSGSMSSICSLNALLLLISILSFFLKLFLIPQILCEKIIFARRRFTPENIIHFDEKSVSE